MIALYHKSPKKAISKHNLCNSRTNEIHELLQSGKDVKVFLNKG